jgi:hypothetical protein
LRAIELRYGQTAMQLTGRRILIVLAVAAAMVVVPLVLLLTAFSPSTLPKPEAYMGPLPQDEIVLTLAGDTAWTKSALAQRFQARSGTSGDHPIAEAFSAISSEINGDLNFINAETVISNREDLSPVSKGGRCSFHFLSKPTDFNYLVSRGINLVSLANNHVLDYGEAGLRETLHSLKKLEAFGLKAFAGAGFSYDEASEPKRISVRDATIAFSAIGVVGDQAPRQRADLDRPAAADIDSADDLSLILKRLKRSPADYRILSIHQGIEGRSVVEADEARLWRRAVREGELGLIAGHHAHVTRGCRHRGIRSSHLRAQLFITAAGRSGLGCRWDALHAAKRWNRSVLLSRGSRGWR